MMILLSLLLFLTEFVFISFSKICLSNLLDDFRTRSMMSMLRASLFFSKKPDKNTDLSDQKLFAFKVTTGKCFQVTNCTFTVIMNQPSKVLNPKMHAMFAFG